MEYLRQFLRQDREYFLNNETEIRRQNHLVLKLACVFYLLILSVYTGHTVLSGQSPELARMYYVYDIIHIFLCLLLFGHKAWAEAHSNALRGALEVSVLSFFLLEAVFPFPAQQSIYYPFPLILLIMLFAIPARRVLALIVSYVLPFVVLVLLFKDKLVCNNDIFLASGTLVSALVGYGITASLRHTTGVATSRLRRLSNSDPLTGLYNKTAFAALCRPLLAAENNGYALLFLDMDRFKQVNDRFGHQMGDTLLCRVAQALEDTFAPPALLCRFGGDEFVAFLPEVRQLPDIQPLLDAFQERMRELAHSLELGELSCSVGVAMKQAPGESYDALLARGDAALYAVKQQGRQPVSAEEQHFLAGRFQAAGGLFPAPAAAAVAEPSLPLSSRRRTVLVVDDEPVNRMMLRKILISDYRVEEAENGREALAKLKANPQRYDAVLLDLLMPELDGYGVLAALRQDSSLAQIPVLAATAEEEAELKALSLGANDFILKPYKPMVIRCRLENTIHLRETAAMINAVERDALTGVYSKEFFYERAAEHISQQEPGYYDLVCCDVERFKLVNDIFGQPAGDALLRRVAALLAQGAPVCGRIGADQFAVLLPHGAAPDNTEFAALCQQANDLSLPMDVNLRFGIYPLADENTPVSTMCDRALTACNAVKGKYGLYFAVYDQTMREKALTEQFILDSMRAGLEQRQFLVYYQPKYSLQSNTMVGAEALVRWQHPERGMLSPNEFIPIFERNGFISDLDLYVWETACRDFSGWFQQGLPLLPVSVNMSRADIYNPELPRLLLELIQGYGLDPSLLHLEITESAYTEDSDQLIHAVEELRKLGFPIEMDDFGTGYSSLNLLSQLPINVLKLDIGFIQSQTAPASRQNGVLEFTLNMAKRLRLSVVAEGVENAEQAAFLRELGCDYAQGYYYGKPLPKEEFVACLAKESSQV